MYPELSGDGGRARLVVLAAEVGGRWSAETAGFLSALAKARAETMPFLMQSRAQAAWLRRWSAMLACSAARTFSMSLLEQRLALGTGSSFHLCKRCCVTQGLRERALSSQLCEDLRLTSTITLSQKKADRQNALVILKMSGFTTEFRLFFGPPS